MEPSVSENAVKAYLQEGLVAVIPTYTENIRAIVITRKCEHRDQKTVPWLITRLTTYFALSLTELRKDYGKLLGIKHHITIPLNHDLILLPVKVRSAAVPGELTIGYISMVEIEAIKECDVDDERTPWLSVISFRGIDYRLKTLNSTNTLRDRRLQGTHVRNHYIAKRNQTYPAHPGLNQAAILSQIPNCDCALLDIYMRVLGCEKEKE